MARPKIDQMKITGNLVEDPKPHTTDAGQDLLFLKVAENHRVYDREAQQWTDGQATFYQVAIDADSRRLGNLARNVESSLHKGDRVSVEGAYTAVPYQAKDGSLGINHKIWAEEVSPSLKFASASIERNPAPVAEMGAEAEADFSQGWETVAPGSGVVPQAPPQQPAQQHGGPGMN